MDFNLLQRVYLTRGLQQGLSPLPRAHEQHHVAAVTCGAFAGGGGSVTRLPHCCGVSASQGAGDGSAAQVATLSLQSSVSLKANI